MNTLKQTNIHLGTEEYRVDPGTFEHANYSVLQPVGETLDTAQIQHDLADYVKTLGLEGKYDVPLGTSAPLSSVQSDPSILFNELGDAPDAFSELTKFCARAASSLGFDETATLSVGLQGDKYGKSNNINEVPHRDGARGAKDHKSATIRFVYPIGRPGPLVFPGIQEQGVFGKQAYSEEKGMYIERTDHNPDDPGLLPRFIPNGDTGVVESTDEIKPDSGTAQIIPGNLLVFDMTNSPWHAAPEPTIDGAVFTVDVRQSEPLSAAA